MEQIFANNQQNTTTYTEDERTSSQEDTNDLAQETQNTVTDNKPMLEPTQRKRISSKYNLRQSPHCPKKLTDLRSSLIYGESNVTPYLVDYILYYLYTIIVISCHMH